MAQSIRVKLLEWRLAMYGPYSERKMYVNLDAIYNLLASSRLGNYCRPTVAPPMYSQTPSTLISYCNELFEMFWWQSWPIKASLLSILVVKWAFSSHLTSSKKKIRLDLKISHPPMATIFPFLTWPRVFETCVYQVIPSGLDVWMGKSPAIFSEVGSIWGENRHFQGSWESTMAK
jgi:hypothetical protein